MDAIFDWPLILWLARLLVVLLLTAGIVGTTVLLFQFLRPKSLKRFWRAELPMVRQVKGEAELLGQKLNLTADLERANDVQITSLDARVESLERLVIELESKPGVWR